MGGVQLSALDLFIVLGFGVLVRYLSAMFQPEPSELDRYCLTVPQSAAFV